ncbi:hypothetical protein ACGFX4_28775 [Kitasatospora sp. NPDC048365]|uniref:hypothetical protein n=1 Tax=Kitasatospora sp. NPDC048365 TaxID=3364050 RepID=UPI0037155255
MRIRTACGAAGAAALLLVTACGSGNDPSPATAPPSAPAAATVTATATATVTATTPPATPTARATVTTTAPAADPAATVQAYYAAINARDYRTAWALGGRNLDHDYAHFAAGFADTADDLLTVDAVHGDTVDVRLHAVHTDSSWADFAGSYTVTGGVIVRAAVRQVASSAPTAPALPAGTGALNPAVTQATISTTICVKGWTATVRPSREYTDEAKKSQLAASGRADQDLTHYQEDFIVPLELGGDPTVANLRPVPIQRAHQDDGLADHLHTEVCAGRMSLDDARTQILQAKADEG